MGPGGFKFFADALVIFHLCFVGFVLLGGLVVLLRRWAMIVHLPCLAWGIYVELSHRICPLTPLENNLRQHAGLATYSGGFVDHYIMPVLYPDGLTPQAQVGIACAIIVINAVAYGRLIYLALGRRQCRVASEPANTPVEVKPQIDSERLASEPAVHD